MDHARRAPSPASGQFFVGMPDGAKLCGIVPPVGRHRIAFSTIGSTYAKPKTRHEVTYLAFCVAIHASTCFSSTSSGSAPESSTTS